MTALITAFGLAIVLEGCLYALFPNFMRRMMIMVLATPVPQIRTLGLVTAAIGLIIVWLATGH